MGSQNKRAERIGSFVFRISFVLSIVGDEFPILDWWQGGDQNIFPRTFLKKDSAQYPPTAKTVNTKRKIKDITTASP
jgi:hypothetical protein